MAWPPVNPENPPSPPSSRGRKRRRLIALASALAFVATGVTVLAPTTPAHASPSTSQQIDDLNNQVEVIIEQYNGINTKLATDQAESKRLKKVLEPAQLESLGAQKHISAVVRDLYIGGPTSGLMALMESSSTQQAAEAMGMLQVIAGAQRQTITSANALVTKYQTKKASLDKLIATETTQKAELGAKKKEILAKLANLQALQAANSGGGGSINQGAKTSKSYVMPVACPQVSSGGAGYTAAKKACSLVWPIHWYGFATAGPTTYDCSGLTMTAWKAAGVSLAHFTGDQWSESHSISKSDLRVGDLVFYNGGNHVAIYIGNGFIVQAEHTGEPLKESVLNFEPVVASGYRRVNGT